MPSKEYFNRMDSKVDNSYKRARGSRDKSFSSVQRLSSKAPKFRKI